MLPKVELLLPTTVIKQEELQQQQQQPPPLSTIDSIINQVLKQQYQHPQTQQQTQPQMTDVIQCDQVSSSNENSLSTRPSTSQSENDHMTVTLKKPSTKTPRPKVPRVSKERKPKMSAKRAKTEASAAHNNSTMPLISYSDNFNNFATNMIPMPPSTTTQVKSTSNKKSLLISRLLEQQDMLKRQQQLEIEHHQRLLQQQRQQLEIQEQQRLQQEHEDAQIMEVVVQAKDIKNGNSLIFKFKLKFIIFIQVKFKI